MRSYTLLTLIGFAVTADMLRYIASWKANEDALNSDKATVGTGFALKAHHAGTLTIVTRWPVRGYGSVLEACTNNDFSKPTDRSDQDLDGTIRTNQ